MSAVQSPYEPFSLSVVPDRRAIAVVPCGEIDIACAGQLEEEVRALVEAGFDDVVVDLRRVVFIDSTGLRTLLTLRNEAARDGHRLLLVPGSPEIQRLFEITATRELFEWRRDCPTGPAV